MNKFHFVVFLSIFLSVYFGMHYFVFTRIAGGLALSGAARTALKVLFFAAGLTLILTEFLTHRGAAGWLKPFAEFGYIWLGVLSIALSLFLVTEILRIFFQSPAFRYNSTVIALVLLAASSTYSLINVAAGPVLRELKIKTDKLPAGTNSFTIVQLSDLHVDMLTTPAWLEGIVSRTNALEPDVVVITGDLIDSNICDNPLLCASLRDLKTRYGVYAVSGNHEYYTGMEKFYNTARGGNFTIIDGRKVMAGAVELVGISDLASARAVKAESDIKSALGSAPAAGPAMFSVLLSHRPDTFDAAAKLGIDLQLSGHVHAGQIPPMDLIVMLAYKYPYGFYRQGNSYAYTTSGTGIWGPPMRLFSRSEIVKIVLER